MLITNKLIYIELHKTGCTHTRTILADMFKESHRIIGKHNNYESVPSNLMGDFNNKIKIGNIRNPWDWYVSLWAYGCQKQGGLYGRLTKDDSLLSKDNLKHILKRYMNRGYPRLNPTIWRQLYSDPNNYANFNSWLHLILSIDKHDIGEDYKINTLSEFSGLLTFRYLRLYTYRKNFKNIDSRVKLKEYDINENFMDFTIKNERINEDLITLAKKIHFEEKKLISILKNYTGRINKSSRERDYRKYYNDKSISLVEKYEQFIVDKYNYQFEDRL